MEQWQPARPRAALGVGGLEDHVNMFLEREGKDQEFEKTEGQ